MIPKTSLHLSLLPKLFYKAATDPSNHLRYPAGQDAEEFLLTERVELNDDEFISKMAQRFGIDIG